MNGTQGSIDATDRRIDAAHERALATLLTELKKPLLENRYEAIFIAPDSRLDGASLAAAINRARENNGLAPLSVHDLPPSQEGRDRMLAALTSSSERTRPSLLILGDLTDAATVRTRLDDFVRYGISVDVASAYGAAPRGHDVEANFPAPILSPDRLLAASISAARPSPPPYNAPGRERLLYATDHFAPGLTPRARQVIRDWATRRSDIGIRLDGDRVLWAAVFDPDSIENHLDRSQQLKVYELPNYLLAPQVSRLHDAIEDMVKGPHGSTLTPDKTDALLAFARQTSGETASFIMWHLLSVPLTSVAYDRWVSYRKPNGRTTRDVGKLMEMIAANEDPDACSVLDGQYREYLVEEFAKGRFKEDYGRARMMWDHYLYGDEANFQEILHILISSRDVYTPPDLDSKRAVVRRRLDRIAHQPKSPLSPVASRLVRRLHDAPDLFGEYECDAVCQSIVAASARPDRRPSTLEDPVRVLEVIDGELGTIERWNRSPKESLLGSAMGLAGAVATFAGTPLADRLARVRALTEARAAEMSPTQLLELRGHLESGCSPEKLAEIEQHLLADRRLATAAFSSVIADADALSPFAAARDDALAAMRSALGTAYQACGSWIEHLPSGLQAVDIFHRIAWLHRGQLLTPERIAGILLALRPSAPEGLGGIVSSAITSTPASRPSIVFPPRQRTSRLAMLIAHHPFAAFTFADQAKLRQWIRSPGDLLPMHELLLLVAPDAALALATAGIQPAAWSSATTDALRSFLADSLPRGADASFAALSRAERPLLLARAWDVLWKQSREDVAARLHLEPQTVCDTGDPVTPSDLPPSIDTDALDRAAGAGTSVERKCAILQALDSFAPITKEVADAVERIAAMPWSGDTRPPLPRIERDDLGIPLSADVFSGRRACSIPELLPDERDIPEIAAEFGERHSREITYRGDVIPTLLPTIRKLLKDLRPACENEEYSVILGDDSSGRVPTLLIAKTINSARRRSGLPPLPVVFLEGTKRPHERAQIEAFSRIETLTLSRVDTGKRALIITERVGSGGNVGSLIERLHDAGMSCDVASYGDASASKLASLVASGVWRPGTRTVAGNGDPSPLMDATKLSGLTQRRPKFGPGLASRDAAVLTSVRSTRQDIAAASRVMEREGLLP